MGGCYFPFLFAATQWRSHFRTSTLRPCAAKFLPRLVDYDVFGSLTVGGNQRQVLLYALIKNGLD